MAPAVTSVLGFSPRIDDRCTNPTASLKLGWRARKSQTACPWAVTYSGLGTGTPSCFNASTNAASTISFCRLGIFGTIGLGGRADPGAADGGAAADWVSADGVAESWRCIVNITTTAPM